MTEQKKRGPKVKFGPRRRVHVQFSQEQLDFINSISPDGMQAYLDKLINREMEARKAQ